MLKLKRSPGQSIMIGDELKITLEKILSGKVLLSINGQEITINRGEIMNLSEEIELYILSIFPDTISIGIHAPKEIPIFRQEIYNRIQKRKAKNA